MREMTIEDYLNNPAGVGAAVIPNKELIRGDLTKRFEDLYSKKQGSFNGNVYKDGSNYFIHVVIPSESNEKENTYDVVIKFVAKASTGALVSTNVKGYNIQIFSNSPSFTYTYAYVFDKEKLLVSELKNKFTDSTFEPPTTRNPYNMISYEKTTFMAIMYILSNPSLLEKSTLNKGHGLSRLKGTVRNIDEIKMEQAKEKNRLTNLKTSQEISKNKKDKLIASTDTPKNRTVSKTTNKKKPIKPKSKIRPKAKTTAKDSLRRQRKK